MSTSAKALVFLAAILVGVFAGIYPHYAPLIAAGQLRLHVNTVDFMIWVFGLMFIGGAVYTLIARPESLSWRWGLLIVIGATMIYAEVADVPWLKEASCRAFVAGRNHRDSPTPCYQPG